MTSHDGSAEELNPYASTDEPARGEIRPPTPATHWLRDRLSLLASGVGCFSIAWGTIMLLFWVWHWRQL